MKNTLNAQPLTIKARKTAYAGIAHLYDKWCSGDPFYEQTRQFYLNILPLEKEPFLELGVGTGRLALSLVQNYAIDVTGIDICSEMLAICESRYQQQKKSGCPGILHLEQGNMTKLQYREQFKTIYLPFRTVGHLLNQENLLAMFHGAYCALKPGGVFMLDHYMFDKAWAEKHNGHDLPMYRDKMVKIEDNYIYDFEKGRMDCRIKVNGIVADQFIFRWYSIEEIGNTAREAGFILEKLMGEFDGSEWNEQSSNQIWLWRK